MYLMEEITDSIGNGQRKEALRKLEDSTYTMRELFDELEAMGKHHEVLVMFTIAQNNNYITVKGEQMCDLYVGQDCWIDYKETGDDDLIEYFEKASNFEGWARVSNFDNVARLVWIEDCTFAISYRQLIVLDDETNEWEYYSEEDK